MSFEIKQGEKQKYKVEVYKTMEGSHFEINITSQIFCIVRWIKDIRQRLAGVDREQQDGYTPNIGDKQKDYELKMQHFLLSPSDNQAGK